MNIRLVTVHEKGNIYYQIRNEDKIIVETMDKEAAENAYRLLNGLKKEVENDNSLD